MNYTKKVLIIFISLAFSLSSAFAEEKESSSFKSSYALKCYEKELLDYTGDICYSSVALLDVFEKAFNDDGNITEEGVSSISEAITHSSFTCAFELNLHLESLEIGSRVIYQTHTQQLLEASLNKAESSAYDYSIAIEQEGFASGTPIYSNLSIVDFNKADHDGFLKASMTSDDGGDIETKEMVCIYGQFE